jgi:hypothetical protein
MGQEAGRKSQLASSPPHFHSIQAPSLWNGAAHIQSGSYASVTVHMSVISGPQRHAEVCLTDFFGISPSSQVDSPR